MHLYREASRFVPTALLGAFILAQFATWWTHDLLQQYLFTLPGFSTFGCTMALALQSTCVLGSLLEQAFARAFGSAAQPEAKVVFPKARSSVGALPPSRALRCVLC